MNVVFNAVGHVVVDHVGDVLYVYIRRECELMRAVAASSAASDALRRRPLLGFLCQVSVATVHDAC